MDTTLKTFAFPVLTCLLLRPCGGQQAYVHRSWGTDKGLPQSSVTSIVQTRDGFLWLGTLGGIARFDGISFTVFDTTNTPALKSSRVRALYEDGDANLWIGTEHGGLTRYHNGVFQSFAQVDGLPADVVTSLTGDGHKGVFIGTTDGMAHWDGARLARLQTSPPLPHDTLLALYRDHLGHLWGGTEGSGLIEICPLNGDRYQTTLSIPSRSIAAVAEDADGVLWIGAKTGLFRLSEAGRLVSLQPAGGQFPGAVQALYKDTSGTLWVGASGGLFRLRAGRLTLFSKVKSGGSDSVRAITTDSEGSLWTGTNAEGLQQWVRTYAQSFGASQGLTDSPTASLYQDAEGDILIGSIGAGLFRYRQGHFEKIEAFSDSIRSPASLTQDASGVLWLGDWDKGLVRLEGGRAVSVAIPGLGSKIVRSEYVDSHGTLWIGTDHRGLYKYENGVFTNYRTKDGLLGDVVVYIYQDRAGTLWLGYPEGISSFDGSKFTNYQNPDMRLVRTIYEDANGALWIGTYGYGLFRFRAGKFARITTKDGLFDVVVSCILPDGKGNFWMSGNRGIYSCRSQELNEFVERKRERVYCSSYGAQDGLQTSETNGIGEPAGLAARDGKLWFPMVTGVAVIDPEGPGSPVPPVVIEQVMVDQKPVPASAPLRVPPSTKSLQIDYGTLSFLRPEQTQFKYRLEGLDTHWVDGSTRRTVIYQNLAARPYEFRVIGDNGYGVWNTRGASLAFSVVPPLWQRTWFVALSVLLLTTSVVFLYQFRLRQVKQAHAVQENFSRQLIDSQERERQRIAAELHDSLGQSLLVIKNRAFLAMTAKREDETIRQEQLQGISTTASEAINEVRTIAHNLHPRQLSRFGLTKALRSMCLEASGVSGIHFSHEVEPIDDLFPKPVEASIYRVAQECVNNVIKHSQATEAKLLVGRQNRQVHLQLTDNGCGFDIRSSHASAGSVGGFGLLGIYQRVKMIGGLCQIVSSPGSGTTIDIYLPGEGKAYE